MNFLQNKRILLGVSGSIAAYRSLDLIRLLQEKDAEIKVILTKGATNFITPLSFSAISRHHVYTDIFKNYPTIIHLELANWADVLIIVPATANIIAKLAQGIADDLLSSIILAFNKPILIVPAMNPKMYAHPTVKANIERLKSYGYQIMQPAEGKLACNEKGKGRLPSVEDILETIEALFLPKDLKGYCAIITAGPTREAIDPVRFISNYSSGLMGFALAKIAAQRGANVILISGPTNLKPPYNVNFISVITAEEMKETVLKYFPQADVVMMAAAVVDFKPIYQSEKIKKRNKINLNFELTPDILKILGERKKHQFLIGFAAETGELIVEAIKKLKEKNLDIIVLNDITYPNAGFGVLTNKVRIIYKNGVQEVWPLLSKEEIAMRLWDRVKMALCRNY
ncbi:MAG TPA: bifunctional phosphopantothenoylcysteine decarboxylase/phosphopantothenate--cysteine ligase CoaBC [Candidatus Desulfofervidus auxilii]|uniref:Coenzyme A biosynthesis bifunctional protein CoaBC n=1 Tax=Desulfofervidus auxilii TaxID=1621989 RepID=A0A7C0U1J8_DESA2|nr:bifunctional phosphopantothenoylcysteine decarboxylase/phosphopantothenate--cysteine ligase CoaBC [Candidatus Desulfofervidus auxilii]